jgi:hypothetical protein
MKKLLILLAVVMTVSTPMAPQAKAVDFSISIGDRPYFHGPRYWHEGYEWVWVPGYRHHGRWTRGHYERRGGWHRDRARIHFRHHSDWRFR